MPLLKLGEGEQLPTLQQLESALLGEVPPAPPPPPAQQEQPLSPTAGGGPMEGVEEEQQAAAPPPDAAVQLQMVLLEFLVGGLFQDTAQAIIGACSFRSVLGWVWLSASQLLPWKGAFRAGCSP